MLCRALTTAKIFAQGMYMPNRVSCNVLNLHQIETLPVYEKILKFSQRKEKMFLRKQPSDSLEKNGLRFFSKKYV